MNYTAAAIAVILLFAVQCWFTIWSRRGDRLRFTAVALFIASIPLIALAALEGLSWPRPLWAMYELPADMHILAAKIIQDEAIYVYVDTDAEPRSVKLPWDTRQAENLQDLFDDPANKGQAMMHWEFSWDTHPPTFQPMPQPPIPMPKIETPEAPHLEL